MTSATELKAAALDVRGFLGVFSSDTLPNNFLPGQSLICNYDPALAPGSHWIAMKRAPSGECLYFDSFGMPPDAEDNILHDQTQFGKWLKAHSTGTIRWNEFDFQDLRNDTCGQWAVAFVRIGVLPPLAASLNRRVAALRGLGTHHRIEAHEAKRWLPLMRGSAIARDARVKRVFDKSKTRAPSSR